MKLFIHCTTINWWKPKMVITKPTHTFPLWHDSSRTVAIKLPFSCFDTKKNKNRGCSSLSKPDRGKPKKTRPAPLTKFFFHNITFLSMGEEVKPASLLLYATTYHPWLLCGLSMRLLRYNLKKFRKISSQK